MEVGTVFSIIGKGISLARAIWQMYDSMKELQKTRRTIQSQVGVLMDILGSIESDDSLRDPKVYNEVQKALENLGSILEEVVETCASFDRKKALEALKSFEDTTLWEKVEQAKKVAWLTFFAKGKIEALHQLIDQQLKLALSIVQMAFSCTQVKQVQQLEAHLTTEFQRLNFVDSTIEVYGNPNGVPPKSVKSIKAKVSNQRLIVSWEDGEVEGHTPKYEVRYLENTYLHVTTAETSVAIGSRRIKPWQNYAIQVRAVNDAGASPWSFPPFYIRMTEGPPSRPTILTVEATKRQSVKVFPDKPPEDQGVTHIIIEWRVKSETQWKWEQSEVDKDDEYTITQLSFAKEYLIRVRYQNRFDISEPSAEVPVTIENMYPSAPYINAQIYSKTAAIINFKSPSVNPGAVDRYLVQVGEYSQEIEGDTLINEHASFILPDLTSDQLKTCGVKVRVIAKNATVEVKGAMKGESRKVPDSTSNMVALSHRFNLGVLQPFTQPFELNASILASAELTALRFETPFAETAESTALEYETLEIAEPTVSTTFSD